MESDESIDFVDSEAVNAYGSVVAKEEHENPCEHFEEGENVNPPRFHPFINFFLNWSLPSLLNRTKGQLRFPTRGEELALERVVGVVVHAKQQIRTTERKVCTITSRNISTWVCPIDFDGRKEMSSLSLKTVVVHKSVTSLMTETNLQKGGLVHRVLCTKSREKL